MANIVLNNCLNKLALEPNGINNEKRREAIVSIIGYLRRSHEEYEKLDGEKKEKTREIIVEAKAQIIEELRKIVAEKGLYGQSSLITRVMSDFQQVDLNLSRDAEEEKEEEVKKVKEALSQDVKEMIFAMQDQEAIESKKGLGDLRVENKAELPAIEQKSIWRNILDKIKNGFNRVRQSTRKNKKELGNNIQGAMPIQQGKGVNEGGTHSTVRNPEVRTTATNQYGETVGFCERGETPYYRANNPYQVRRVAPNNIPQPMQPMQQTYQNSGNNIGFNNYGQVAPNVRRPVEAPGYTVQRPLSEPHKNQVGFDMPYYRVNSPYQVRRVAPNNIPQPMQPMQQTYQNSGNNIGFNNYGQVAPNVRRPVDAPGYTVQRPLSERVPVDENQAFRRSMVIPCQELGINPDTTPRGAIVEKDGRTYRRVENGMVEIIDSTKQGGERGDE
ncbi:MAG: hypothetical protein ACI4U9_02630 [Clostridia bacterium]